MTPTHSTPHTPSARARWLAVLAHAPRDLLKRHVESLPSLHFEVLRAPEIGLAMLRGRIGNKGDRFNVGEATITRCVVRHRDGETASIGIGYVLGRDPERVDWIARMDALLQHPRWHDALQADVIAPLAAESARLRASEQRETATSRVHFFNLQPEASS
ncbi:MAG: phosphonate C-P lyase system protein PhnG [Variovorax sp.]|nr:phosphonate C-P lyase system protein PhnG [Variovorax sp.]